MMEIKEAIEILKDNIKSRKVLDEELGEENKLTTAMEVATDCLSKIQDAEMPKKKEKVPLIAGDLGSSIENWKICGYNQALIDIKARIEEALMSNETMKCVITIRIDRIKKELNPTQTD